MARNKKVMWAIIAGMVLLIAGAVTLFVISKKKDAANRITLDESGTVTDGSGNVLSSGSEILKLGSRGSDVRRLQTYLNERLVAMYYLRGDQPKYNGETINSLAVDGIFGQKTLCVVRWEFNRDTVNVNEING